MKTVVKLSVNAGRKFQSAQTGFIHFQDLIPLYENLCFVLALFRSHIGEQVLEGRALLQKLFHFEVNGHFPIHLHEYPECRDQMLSRRMRPLFYWLYKDFATLLGESLREKVRAFLDKTEPFPIPSDPRTPEEWAQYLVAVQMREGEAQVPYLEKACAKWHPELSAFCGHQPHQRAEPAATLFDLFMGELYGTFSRRALEPGIHHLRASLVQPFAWQPPACAFPQPIYIEEKGVFIAWGSKEHLHTFVSFQEFEREGEQLTLTLPEIIPAENESEECVFYCNFHAEHTLLVNGKRATVFQVGDLIEILSKGLRIELSFQGERHATNGVFCGLIAKTNRPHQPKIAQFEANDWKIALRTVRRAPKAKIYCKLGLFSASPIACMPLST